MSTIVIDNSFSKVSFSLALGERVIERKRP